MASHLSPLARQMVTGQWLLRARAGQAVYVLLRAEGGWADCGVHVTGGPVAGVAAEAPAARDAAAQAVGVLDEDAEVRAVARAFAALALQAAVFGLPCVDAESVLAGDALAAIVHPFTG
jgi:hypothetical protein